jgi:hypothetical protein
MSLKPKTYPILVEAVENGVQYGYLRSYKHTDDPSPEQIQDTIVQSVINEILEWFDIDDHLTTRENEDND